MSESFTQEQQTAVASRGRVIVSASAGSGKTTVMIERLVSLILSGEADVKEVLCVTFTNKAAAQMREKLRKKLVESIATCGDELLRRRLKEQLFDLPLADICTIHSFCGRLLRSRFYLVGLDPAFRIIGTDDAAGKALAQKALDETFENAYAQADGEFSDLLDVWFYKKKDKRLRSLVLLVCAQARAFGDGEGVLNRVGAEDLFYRAGEAIEGVYKRRLEAYLRYAREAEAYFSEKNARAVKAAQSVAAACGELLNKNGLFAMAAAERPAIATMPPSTKAEGEDLLRLKRLSFSAKGVKAVCSELAELGTEEEEHALCESARVRARALGALAGWFESLYAEKKREAGVLDYDDLERYALQVLEQGGVAEELRKKYKYVFVDEYQDVNRVQEKIISLAGGNEVFLVGDAKQAIYGFRGSRSQYFIAKTKAYSCLRLSRNFRSSSAVLEAVNRVFARVYGEYVPMTGGDRYGGFQGETQFHLLPEKQKGEERERGVYSVKESVPATESDPVSDEVMRLIEKERGATFFDADLGRERRVEWGDIAVLVRKNTGDAERIVRAAIARGIPVTASAKVNACAFYESRLVIDWLSLLDNAKQDIPLGTALLSSIGGFTNDELASIRLRMPSPYTFREACESYAKNMDDGIARKLKAFYIVYARLRALSRVRSAAEMVNTLLSEGLQREIVQKGGAAARLAHVERLIAEAGEDSVHDFLARLKALQYNVEYSESGGENAVKVHTMHASKGLEYPVVILTGLDASFHGAERDEIMWSENFLAAPKSYDTVKKTVRENLVRRAVAFEEEEKERDEERNLLYVAMTRARYRLHLLFAGKEANPPEFACRFSDYIDLTETGDYFVEGEALAPPVPRKQLEVEPDEALVHKILSFYARPYPYEEATRLHVKSSATALMAEAHSDEEHDFPEGRGFTKEEGVAYHAFLERVRFGADIKEELARMLDCGELTKEQTALLSAQKLQSILSIPCLAALAGKNIKREQTFLIGLPAYEMENTRCADEIIYQGAIDLLVEDENGFTVIDYKYSGRSDDAIRARYAVQIKLYKKAVARLMRVREESVRALIVNIAFERQIEM